MFKLSSQESWRQTDYSMGSLEIVFMFPSCHLSLRIEDGGEDLFVEELISDPSVKRFDEGILLRLSWLNGDVADASLCAPTLKFSALELRPAVGSDKARKSAKRRHCIESLNKLPPRDRRISIELQTLPGGVIDERQEPKCSARGQGITHKVH